MLILGFSALLMALFPVSDAMWDPVLIISISALLFTLLVYLSAKLVKMDGDVWSILLVATFLLRGRDDPTYARIENGAWLNSEPYATIHRIAGNGKVHGVLHAAIEFALQQYDNIRIDTHRDNRVMQRAVRKEGFRYCGIIYCWSGDERLAYQYAKSM